MEIFSGPDEKDLYVHALKQLEKHGKQSEFSKVAEKPQEKDLMKEASRLSGRRLYEIVYSEGQYDRIFKGKDGKR